MVRAIIFDCFDVLVSSGFPSFVAKYIPTQEAEVAWTLETALNSGRIDYTTFVQKLSELSDMPWGKVGAILDDNRADELLFTYIREELKPHYKIGMLSNAGDNWLDEMIGPERVALFDDIVLSYDVGFTKPQPEIYLLAAKRLSVEPDECVFIDDRAVYCLGAELVGMSAVTFKNTPTLKRQMIDIL